MKINYHNEKLVEYLRSPPAVHPETEEWQRYFEHNAEDLKAKVQRAQETAINKAIKKYLDAMDGRLARKNKWRFF